MAYGENISTIATTNAAVITNINSEIKSKCSLNPFESLEILCRRASLIRFINIFTILVVFLQQFHYLLLFLLANLLSHTVSQLVSQFNTICVFIECVRTAESAAFSRRRASLYLIVAFVVVCSAEETKKQKLARRIVQFETCISSYHTCTQTCINFYTCMCACGAYNITCRKIGYNQIFCFFFR